jgi:peptidoglycan/xylan/chitin deacetylase (PgdA/CDA1 family)
VLHTEPSELRVRVAAGQVALTFDDGPDPVWTPRVLEALRRHRAAATFFVIAERATEYPQLIETMTEHGHEPALHCFRHVRHSDLSASEIRADAERGLEALSLLGVEPRAWRTPWGVVTDATRAVAAELSLQLWGWTHDTHDWRGDEAKSIVDGVGESIENGPVVLMHDALGPGALRSGCDQTVSATEALLDRAVEAGLQAVTVSGSSESHR